MDDVTDFVMRRSAWLAENIEAVVDAMFVDLGESPEAIRAAGVVAETGRILLQSIITDDVRAHDDRQMEIEMQGVGAVLALLMRSIHQHCLALEPPPRGGGFDS